MRSCKLADHVCSIKLAFIKVSQLLPFCDQTEVGMLCIVIGEFSKPTVISCLNRWRRDFAAIYFTPESWLYGVMIYTPRPVSPVFGPEIYCCFAIEQYETGLTHSQKYSRGLTIRKGWSCIGLDLWYFIYGWHMRTCMVLLIMLYWKLKSFELTALSVIKLTLQSCMSVPGSLKLQV